MSCVDRGGVPGHDVSPKGWRDPREGGVQVLFGKRRRSRPCLPEGMARVPKREVCMSCADRGCMPCEDRGCVPGHVSPKGWRESPRGRCACPVRTEAACPVRTEANVPGHVSPEGWRESPRGRRVGQFIIMKDDRLRQQAFSRSCAEMCRHTIPPDLADDYQRFPSIARPKGQKTLVQLLARRED